MNREQAKWFPKKPKCENIPSNFTPIGIVEIRPALVIFVIGVGVAFTIFLIEIAINKVHKK